MYLVVNTVGEYEDYQRYEEIVQSGKLAAYLDTKRSHQSSQERRNLSLYLVENFGEGDTQTVTPIPDDPEALFPTGGSCVHIVFLNSPTSISAYCLRLSVTVIPDDALERAISMKRDAFEYGGWCGVGLDMQS